MRRGTLRKALCFAARKPRDAWLVFRLAVWVAAVSALVRFLPLPRVLSLVSTAPRARTLAGDRAARLLDALLATDVLCFTPTCWKRAAVLHRYLALAGRPTRVVFGMRKGGGSLLDGHAWLEDHSGRTLFEATPPDYTVTYSFPSPAHRHELHTQA